MHLSLNTHLTPRSWAFFRLWWSRVFAKTRGKGKTFGSRRVPVRRKKTGVFKRVVHRTLGDREESEWIRNRQDQCTDSWQTSSTQGSSIVTHTLTVCVTYTDTHRTLSLFYTRIGNPVVEFIETIRTSSSKSVEYSVDVSKYSAYSVHVSILIYHERDYTGWVNFSTIRSFTDEDKWMSLSCNLKLGLLNHKQYRDPPFPGHLVTMLLVWSRDPSCVIRPPDVRHSAQGWRGVPFLPRFPAPLSPCSNCNSTMGPWHQQHVCPLFGVMLQVPHRLCIHPQSQVWCGGSVRTSSLVK